MRIGDVMVRDPFHTPQEITPDAGLEHALKQCIPKELQGRVIGIICNPATRPNFVIGATCDRKCCSCGQAVWSAPSSKRVECGVYVCLACIERELQNQ